MPAKDEMNHLDIWELEKVSEACARWLTWIGECERIYGRKIDGNEGDGVCLDGAYKAFREGVFAASYIRNAWQYLS